MLALPLEERAELAHELLSSLDGEADEGAGEAWDATIESRARAIKSGLVQTESWASIRERLGKGA